MNPKKVFFIISWLPYSIVSMYRAFWFSSDLSPLTCTLPSIFAKSSLLWTSILYIFTNNQVKTIIWNKINFRKDSLNFTKTIGKLLILTYTVKSCQKYHDPLSEYFFIH